MAELRTEIKTVECRIASASKALTDLETESQQNLGNGLYDLQAKLGDSRRALKRILQKHNRRHFSFALLQTRSQKAVALQRSLDDLIQRFEWASGTATGCLELSEHYHLKSKDFTRYHIGPARESVQSLRENIRNARYRAKQDLEAANAEAKTAGNRLESVRNDIQRKESQIVNNQRDVRNNGWAVERMESQQWEVEQQRQAKLAEARRLRQVRSPTPMRMAMFRTLWTTAK
jgi:hypothetical protein